MNYIDIIYLIFASASISWFWINTDWIDKLKTLLINHLSLPYWFEKLITCLKCSSVWISFGIFIISGYSILDSIMAACMASLLITLIDGYIKIRL